MKGKSLRVLILILVVIFVVIGIGQIKSLAAEDPDRQKTITVPYTEHEWWLIYWSTNQLACQFFTDHDGWPTYPDVLYGCGQDVYNEWVTTPACPPAETGGDTSGCEGFYLHLAATALRERLVVVDLPELVVWVSLSGCEPQPPQNLCNVLPSLIFTAEEPLPNESITAVHVKVGEVETVCESDTCEVAMLTTVEEGQMVEFWTDSTYGDTSAIFEARVRILDTGTFEQDEWFVDVLSAQWKGGDLLACAQLWDTLPPVGGPPHWLSTPEELEALSSDEPYAYLSGRLIAWGLVDASACPYDGLLPNGYADVCGVEAAQEEVNLWQDRFDRRILDVSVETGVPAQLMKNVFAQETQFWPGLFVEDEYGLGQMTEQGAEAVLLWNPDFFAEFCPLVLSADACQTSYTMMSPENQAMLRGALVAQADADCPSCDYGIDLAHANFSIKIFAQSILANCAQVGQVMYNTTGKIAGEVSSYEDLWRFTLVNYNAGPGCLAEAVLDTHLGRNTFITWDDVSSKLEEGCQGAIQYVENISAEPRPTPMPTLAPTATPWLTPTLVPTVTPTLIPTESPTP